MSIKNIFYKLDETIENYCKKSCAKEVIRRQVGNFFSINLYLDLVNNYQMPGEINVDNVI